MIITDTHTHLYSEAFDDDRDEMMQRAFSLGVTRFFVPAIDSSYTKAMFKLKKEYPNNVFLMMGLHPTSVKENFHQEIKLVKKMLEENTYYGIGETGIDLYWDKTFYREQLEAFKTQVQWAVEKKLPIVIHCRESLDETINLVHDLHDGELYGIFHCFTGDIGQAKKIIDMGFYLGIGGVSTFKNGGLDKVIPHIGLENLVLETDSPYLAPAPNRGKRNDPSLLPYIAERIATLKNCDPEEIKEVTTENALRIFKL